MPYLCDKCNTVHSPLTACLKKVKKPTPKPKTAEEVIADFIYELNVDADKASGEAAHLVKALSRAGYRIVRRKR